MIELAEAAARLLFVFVAFVGIPTVLVHAVRRSSEPMGIREYAQVPALAKLSVTAGVILGALVVLHFGREGLYDPGLVFARGGPWDLTFVEFLRLRVAPFATEFVAVWTDDLPRPGSSGGMLLLTATVLWLGACAISFLVWPPRQAVGGALLSAVIVLATAFIVFYLTVGTLWLLNNLVFLVFLIPLLLLRPPFHFVRRPYD